MQRRVSLSCLDDSCLSNCFSFQKSEQKQRTAQDEYNQLAALLNVDEKGDGENDDEDGEKKDGEDEENEEEYEDEEEELIDDNDYAETYFDNGEGDDDDDGDNEDAYS